MLLVKNKKALFNYEVLQKYIAGIKLTGYEVKAIRERKVSFEGAFISVDGDGAYVVNLQISRYSNQSQSLPPESQKRPRRLLLNKRELSKIRHEIKQKGKTTVPLALILQNNLIKLEIAIVKGRKKYEKKIVAKERQIKRDLETQIKSINRG